LFFELCPLISELRLNPPPRPSDRYAKSRHREFASDRHWSPNFSPPPLAEISPPPVFFVMQGAAFPRVSPFVFFFFRCNRRHEIPLHAARWAHCNRTLLTSIPRAEFPDWRISFSRVAFDPTSISLFSSRCFRCAFSAPRAVEEICLHSRVPRGNSRLPSCSVPHLVSSHDFVAFDLPTSSARPRSPGRFLFFLAAPR